MLLSHKEKPNHKKHADKPMNVMAYPRLVGLTVALHDIPHPSSSHRGRDVRNRMAFVA